MIHDLTKEMSCPPQLLGLEALLMPALAHVSSQRATMWSSHSGQAVPLNNSEFPMWFTGFEHKIGQYPFRSSEIKEPCIVQAVIAKYSRTTRTSPMMLVIYIGTESKTIGYCMLEQYVNLSKEFGYKTRWKNTALLYTGTPIDPGTEFEEACNHDGAMYNMGTNANVIYMTRNETTDDAICISQELADKMTHTRVGKITITLPEDVIPLNLYGDSVEYKILPDIDECINDQGILMGIRRIAPDCFMADQTDDSLLISQPINDELFRLPAGAKIVDLDVYLGSEFSRTAGTSTMYEQLCKYNAQSVLYHTKVVETYFQLLEQGYKPDAKFNTLVTRSICMLGIESRRSKPQFKIPAAYQMAKILGDRGRREMQLYNKKMLVPFIQIDITYAFIGRVSLGSKLTGRDGAKGVISAILPKERMPIDDFGIRADMICCPTGAFNRLNPSQFYEQYINRVAMFIRQTALGIKDNNVAFAYVLEFFEMLSLTYADIVRATVRTDAQKEQFMLEMEEKGIHYTIPPFTTNRLIFLVPKLYKKYGIDKTQVSFDVEHMDGTTEHVRSKEKFVIGSKYIVVLGKIPGDDLTAQEAGFVNQHRLPIKISGKTKDTQPVNRTPIRLGEDETGLMDMSLGSDLVVRLLGVHANSPKTFVKMAEQLLTESHPTRMQFVKDTTFNEIVQTSTNISMMQHTLGAVGLRVAKPNYT
jgi:hypothetical protein